jgi:hypothetical protein
MPGGAHEQPKVQPVSKQSLFFRFYERAWRPFPRVRAAPFGRGLVSRPPKDSKAINSTVLEVVRKYDAGFDLSLNRTLNRNNVPEAWLRAELCERFGFWGEEQDSILREVNRNGRTTVVF